MTRWNGRALRAAALAVAVAAAGAAAIPQAHAEPYMSVSADDEAFGRTFAGSMVVEVVVRDPDMRRTGEPSGEPSVTVDGEPLRMAQASDGSWHAYFADIGAAMAADAASPAAGAGMDFGVFCAPTTPESVLGASFAGADGVAVARAAAGGTDGGEGRPGACSGPAGGELLNNVVRRAPRLAGGGGSAVPPGQIGVDPGAWPVVQLYSLGGSVDVEYERAGGSERAELEYDEIPNAAMSLDRERYPAGAEVYVTIRDAQLNQDPTDRDSWTFSTDPGSPAVFYMGGWEGGGGAAPPPPPAADLRPHLRAIGFEDNGALTIDAGRTVSFKPNGLQRVESIEELGGGARSSLVTVRETRASSSEFVSHDGNGRSTVWVPRDAPRGTAATFEYNDGRTSALTGPSTATVGIGAGGGSGGGQAPGTRAAVTITDEDRNANPARRDVLSASDAAPVPSVRIGSPLTLEGAGGAWWQYAGAGGPEPAGHSAIDSGRIAVSRPGTAGASALIIDAGYGADAMRGLQGGASARSTVWLNYDVRSLTGPGGQPGATIGIVLGGGGGAGAAGSAPPAEEWDASAGRGTVRVAGDHAGGGRVAFVVGLPGGAAGAAEGGEGEGEGDAAAVHIDLFSFGVRGGGGGGVLNNAVYRLELEETGAGTGVFEGSIEYVVMDERNGADPSLAASLVAYGDDVRIAASGDMTGDDAVTVSYRDVGGAGRAGPVAADAGAPAHSGSVHLGAASYGFGRPVTITLVDADLNTDHDSIETYRVEDDASSPHADAVAADGALLLDVTIKGERYRRCTVDGVEHGGLAASGFALVETGPATGVFEGTFKMPSWICSADGSRLVSPAGGRIDARYYDYADGRGGASIVDASPREGARAGGGANSAAAAPAASEKEDEGAGGSAEEAAGREERRSEEIQGGGQWTCTICSDAREGPAAAAGPLDWTTQIPADARQIAMLRGGQMSDADMFRVVRSVIEASAGGEEAVPAAQGGAAQGAAPAWFKTVAGWWGDGRISDGEFAVAARYLLHAGIVRLPG